MRTLIGIVLTLILIGFIGGSTYVIYNYVIGDNAATKEQLSTMQQKVDERLQKAKSERSTIRKNQKTLKRKIDSVLWRQKIIMSEQDITQLKIDSLQSDMDKVRNILNRLELGQRIIHDEFKDRESKNFIDKLLE